MHWNNYYELMDNYSCFRKGHREDSLRPLRLQEMKLQTEGHHELHRLLRFPFGLPGSVPAEIFTRWPSPGGKNGSRQCVLPKASRPRQEPMTPSATFCNAADMVRLIVLAWLNCTLTTFFHKKRFWKSPWSNLSYVQCSKPCYGSQHHEALKHVNVTLTKRSVIWRSYPNIKEAKNTRVSIDLFHIKMH